jgi:hypothetical protein
VAAIPVVQLLSLGYLLEAEGRVARTGRLRGSLPGLDLMARVGGAAWGAFFVFLPALLLLDFWRDAVLLDPAAPAARDLRVATFGAFVLAGGETVMALARGGRFRLFFRPIANARWSIARLRAGGAVSATASSCVAFVKALRLGHYFQLGLKGFVAALAWLALPTALLALGVKAPPLGLLGGVALALAVIPLPLLQARLAAEGRLSAGFELRAVWRRFRAAPISALVALVLTLVLAVPPYALKVELIPRDARWLPAVVILALVLPAKLAAGKAYARGARETRANVLLRCASTVVALPLAGAYVGFLFVTLFFEWRGAASLFEQHAFLLPVAFY